MKAFTRLLAVALAALLALGSQVPAQASLDNFLAGLSMDKSDWLILTSEYGRDGQHSQLSLQPGRAAEGEKRGEWVQCSSTKDPKCQGADALARITASPILPDCSATSSEVCVEFIKFGNANGDLTQASYTGDVKKGTEYKAEPEFNLLEGAGLPLYESKSAYPISNTNLFAVMVRPQSFWNKSKNKFVIDRLEVKVIPYKLAPRSGFSLGCAFTVGEQCATLQDFAADTRVELKFRIPNDVGGWFSGRMKAPNISIAKQSATVNAITISAEPVEVASLGIVRKDSELSVKEKTWNENHGGWSTGNGGRATGANSWQEDVFPFIDYYRPLVKDTSIGTNRVWNFMSIGGGSGSKCLQDKTKVLGIVTTNALGYSGESPAFKNGFLDYKVAGLHYAPGGQELNFGVYDFVMRSDTARCLYGFSNAPLSATVSVTNDKGNKTTATTVVSEKNGWLKMAAYGFTFSNKTIKVKISKKSVKPAPKKR
jgi:hypothetical protein